jgi:spermidine/putrescine transport system ATP-binding protein
VYDRPATRFVAGFIGETDFLDAHCVRAEGGSAWFEAAGGELVAEGVAGVAAGERVTLAIRPERVEPALDGEAGLPAVVEAVLFLGTDRVAHARLADGTALRLRLPNRGGRGGSGGLGAGSRVRLRLPPDALRVVAAD